MSTKTRKKIIFILKSNVKENRVQESAEKQQQQQNENLLPLTCDCKTL